MGRALAVVCGPQRCHVGGGGGGSALAGLQQPWPSPSLPDPQRPVPPSTAWTWSVRSGSPATARPTKRSAGGWAMQAGAHRGPAAGVRQVSAAGLGAAALRARFLNVTSTSSLLRAAHLQDGGAHGLPALGEPRLVPPPGQPRSEGGRWAVGGGTAARQHLGARHARRLYQGLCKHTLPHTQATSAHPPACSRW